MRIAKKILIFGCLAAIVFGMRLYDNGLLCVRADGVYTVYQNGTEQVYDARPLFYQGGYTRLDIAGGIQEAEKGLADLSAELLWEEHFDGMVIFYAYSPRMRGTAVVCGIRINVMVAVRNGRVAFGSPLLKGSY